MPSYGFLLTQVSSYSGGKAFESPSCIYIISSREEEMAKPPYGYGCFLFQIEDETIDSAVHKESINHGIGKV